MIDLKKLIAVLLLSSLIVFGLSGCSREEGITLEQFEQISYGMSESEVRRILGSEGMLISSGDLLPASSLIQTRYGWTGVGEEGFAVVSFINGAVTGFRQTGLE